MGRSAKARHRGTRAGALAVTPIVRLTAAELVALYPERLRVAGRAAKPKAFERDGAEWCTHLGPVPTPNRAERRRMAARARKAHRGA